ncbi:hypothetical protein BCR33DRAFT_769240 [Rhizoclosmatium globosum]|uniref:Alpha-type protein kinase domain-containing protein n=1 Tax=Rhizoclosmatium globosum TaxID=329046 RepID=A0A1Y2BUY9_9FUNG|nr:hypothetical protein BCR33DRAFT_769240 [Rhizoclosmatium globosum]|eukprot:ORY38447.1 hypothetical protein BCR33DRAFT_769240 [Rhizoclosmatium globosum]
MNDSRRRHTISQQGLQNLIAASKTRSTGSSEYVPDSRVYATPQAPLQIGQSPSSSSRLLSATQGLNGPTANRLSCDECNKHVLPALLTIVGSFRYCDACKPAANCENCSQPASETYDQARLCRGCFICASRSGVGSNGPQTTHQNIPNMMDQRFHEQERLRNQALSDFNGVRSSAVPAATVSRMLRYTFEIVAYKAVKSKSTNGFVYTEVKNLIQEKMEFSDTTTFRELAAFLTSPQCERINKVYATVEHETASTEIYTMKGNNPGAELNASSLIHKHLPHHTPKLPKKKATAPVARVAVVFVSKQRLVDSEEDEEFAIHTSSRRKVSCQRPEVECSRSLPTGSSAVRMVGRVMSTPLSNSLAGMVMKSIFKILELSISRLMPMWLGLGLRGFAIGDVPSWVVKMQRRDIVLQTPEHVGQQSYCQQQLYAHDFITQCLETYDCLKDHLRNVCDVSSLQIIKPLLAKTADGSTFVLERYLPGTFCKFYANYGFTPINTGDEFDSLNLFFECIMHLSLKDSDGMAILVDIQGTVTQMEKSKSICLTDFQVVTNPAIVSENQFLCFGKGNVTQYFNDFLKNHKCSNLCVEVGLADEMKDETE